MKKCLPAALIILSVLTAGCFSSSDVELVKNGSFSGYPNTTIGKILDSSFEKAKWSSSQTTIGETIVRFDGRISDKLHEKMDAKLYQFLLRLAHGGILNPESIKEKLWQRSMVLGRLPQMLSDINGMDLYGSIKEKYSRIDDCQKLSAATPDTVWRPNGIENTKRELEKIRELYARTGSPYDKEELDKQERFWAKIEVTFTPEWNAKAEECVKKFDSVIKDAINTHYWKTGTQVFLEWKILNDKSGFSLSKFGGDGLPRLTFSDFLKEITSD